MNHALSQCCRRLRQCGLHLLGFLALAISGLHTANTAHAATPPGQLVSVGTHKLHILCRGQGTPTIVLDAGLSGMALEWTPVQDELARSYRVCSYDRAGLGWSEPGPQPRTSARIVTELHTLLEKAAVPGPYILVGHSFGGYTAQLFASRYPDVTAGLLLIDSSHAEQIRRFEEPPLRVSLAPRGKIMQFSTPSAPTNLPPALVATVTELLLLPKTRATTIQELENYRASAAEVAAAAPLPALPLLVLTRGQQVWPATERGQRMEQLWQDLQADLTHLSSDSAQIIAMHSGHYIHLDQPDLVVTAVQRLAMALQQSGPARLHAALHAAPLPPAAVLAVAPALLPQFAAR